MDNDTVFVCMIATDDRIYFVAIDAIDEDLTERHWSSMNSRKDAYAVYYVKRNAVFVHRTILERVLGRLLVRGEFVDHIDGNRLNNKRSNLRLASRSQNGGNRKRNADNTSGYKGVVRENSKARPWAAKINIDGKQRRLGKFATPEEAFEAYCEAARRVYGEFARFE